jgi:hypothetical protein
MVKLDVDTPSTTPDAPPAAGPDLAFVPPPPPAALPGSGGADVGEGDVAHAAVSAITAHISAAAIIDPFLLIDGHRTVGRRSSLAVVIGAG